MLTSSSTSQLAYPATVILPTDVTVPCTLTEISGHEAAFKLTTQQELPSEFVLMFTVRPPSSGRHCWKVWQQGNMVRVQLLAKVSGSISSRPANSDSDHLLDV
jgi:hypothetical protein